MPPSGGDAGAGAAGASTSCSFAGELPSTALGGPWSAEPGTWARASACHARCPSAGSMACPPHTS
eukprot:13581271-Heterocapsa_arctica.AAC.1